MDATATPIAPARANADAPTTPEGKRTTPLDANFTRYATKTHSFTSFSSKVLNTADNAYKEFWANRFRNNSRVIQDIEAFLTKFVPGDEPNIDIPPLANLFANYSSENKEDSDGLVNALKCIMTFFPEERRMDFANTENKRFKSFLKSEHDTRPDVSGTYPGQGLPDNWDWNSCAIAFEVKSRRVPDPIEDSGKFKETIENNRTLAQIAKNGRNILAASGACFSFSVGIYRDTARIYRFDRARVVISPAFNIRETVILFRFLWRIVHPADFTYPNGTILSAPKLLGLDTTITALSGDEMIWLENTLTMKHQYDDEMAKECVDMSKKVLAKYRENPLLTWCYTIGKPLYQSSGLFSRATKVWKVIFREEDDKFFALKDTWQHVYRCNESDFYEHVQDRHGSDYPNGLARAVGGVNIGELFESHKTNSFEPYEQPVDEEASKDESRTALQDDDGENELVVRYSHRARKQRKETPRASVAEDAPTSTSVTSGTVEPTGSRSPVTIDLNRTHARIATYPIGTPIITFTSTQQLVGAIRDAIEGHEGLIRSGLLHRDISANNILLAEDQEFEGFLHDLDYSTYIRELDEKGPDPKLESLSSKMPSVLKEMTGTYQFMARDVLNHKKHHLSHDLESFYWLLLWVVLRHVEHGPDMDYLEEVFDQTRNLSAESLKSSWLSKVDAGQLKILLPNNNPFTWLLQRLTHLFFTKSDVDHKSVLNFFNRALNRDDWPGNDSAIPYLQQHSNPFDSSFISTSTSKRGLEQETVEMDVDEQAPKKRKKSQPGSRSGSRGRAAGHSKSAGRSTRAQPN